MQSKMSAIDAGLIGSIIMISVDLLWCILVFFDSAQTVTDYIFWMHFVKPAYQIEKFDMHIAVYLLSVVAFIGFLGGFLIAKIFNLLIVNEHKN